MGIILPEGAQPFAAQTGTMIGSVRDWVRLLTKLHSEYRQDTFIFWPGGDDTLVQIERYAQEVIPAVREAVAGSKESESVK